MDRFLVIQTAFLGDVILATPVIEKLQAFYPKAHIDVLVRKGNEALLANHPAINQILIWEKGRGKYRSFLKLLQTIRSNDYDCVVNLHRYASSGILTTLSGAKRTIGFDKNPFSPLFHHQQKHTIGNGAHEVERNLGLVEELTDSSFVSPKLYPSEKDFAAIEAYRQSPYICVAPTSVWATKQMPAEKWIEMIDQFPAKYSICLLGGPEDEEACRALIAKCSHARVFMNLAGSLTYLQSAALMQGAVMNYVNDSAPLHIATAMNAPVTAVFCSTVPRFGFGPLSDQSFIVETPIPDLYCRPCGLHGHVSCPEGHYRCAHSIDVNQLLEPFQKTIQEDR